MKKFPVLVLAAAACVSARVCAAGDGRAEMAAVSAGGKGWAEKIPAYLDIADKYPAEASVARMYAAWGYSSLGKYEEARTVADGVIRDYPTNTTVVVKAKIVKVVCLEREKKYAEALAACEACLREHPGILVVSVKRRMVASYLYGLKDYSAGLALLRECVAVAPAGQGSVDLYEMLADTLRRHGNAEEIPAACQEAVLKNAAALGGTDAMTQLFEKVNPVALGVEKYREFLNGVLLRVPAVEANAKFLGRVKSEVEKLK